MTLSRGGRFYIFHLSRIEVKMLLCFQQEIIQSNSESISPFSRFYIQNMHVDNNAKQSHVIVALPTICNITRLR